MRRTIRSLILGLVTAVAIGRHRGVVVVDVATGTCHGGVGTRQREAGVVVVEARWSPSRRAVAYLALLREV